MVRPRDGPRARPAPQSLFRAQARSNDFLVRPHLVSEIGHGHAERCRIVIRAVPRALRRAERARQMVIRESNVGAVLRVQCHLEKVRKRAAIPGAATCAAGANSSSMNEMIAGRMLRKRWHRSMTIHALCHVYIPLRPAIGCSVRARRLHGGNIVGIPSQARA
jgi:hypothetical protein